MTHGGSRYPDHWLTVEDGSPAIAQQAIPTLCNTFLTNGNYGH